jgi:hypothetical protein
MTDFGADDAFAGAAVKLKEHYGIEVPVSAIRWFTEEHGAAMRAQEKQKSDWSDRAGVPVLITEMDGSMLPVVEVAEPVAGEARVDRRKTRQVGWKEARLALAHEPGSVTPIFGATLGSVKEAGERLSVCLRVPLWDVEWPSQITTMMATGVQKAVNEVACEQDNQRHRPHDWQTPAWNKPQPARQ